MADTQWTPNWNEGQDAPEQEIEPGTFGGKLSQANLAATSGWGNLAPASDELAH